MKLHRTLPWKRGMQPRRPLIGIPPQSVLSPKSPYRRLT